MTEALQKQLQTEHEKFKDIQRDYQKMLSTRQQLEGQLNENTMVKEELDMATSDSTVYKLIGPVLVKQDLTEAQQNVQKRLDYIGDEIKRHDTKIQELEKKQESLKETLVKLQQQLQKVAPAGQPAKS